MNRDDVIEATFLEGLDYMDPGVGCKVSGTGRQVGDFRGVESPSAPTLGFFDIGTELQQMGQNAAEAAAAGAAGVVGDQAGGDSGGGHWESPGLPPQPGGGGGLGDSVEDYGGTVLDQSTANAGQPTAPAVVDAAGQMWVEQGRDPSAPGGKGAGGWWDSLEDWQKLALGAGVAIAAYAVIT